MSRKKRPERIVDEQGRVWHPDDFDLDSHGVEAPEEDVFELAAEMGRKPEDVSEEARERYRLFLARRNETTGRKP